MSPSPRQPCFEYNLSILPLWYTDGEKRWLLFCRRKSKIILLNYIIDAKKNIRLQRSHNYGVWNYWQQKLHYCICYTIWIGWHMIFGLEQEGGSLIAPMALAHPLHPIDNRSRNKHQNLWVGWCVSSWWPLFPYIYKVFYMSSVFFGLPIVLLSDDKNLIPGCLWLLTFVDTRYLVFYNPSPPRMFLSLDLLFRISDSTWCHRTHLCHI